MNITKTTHAGLVGQKDHKTLDSEVITKALFLSMESSVCDKTETTDSPS